MSETKANDRNVWKKTNGKCWYCGCRLVWKQLFTMDHVKPQALGGRTILDNLVPACLNCNTLKNSYTLEQYRVYLALIESGWSGTTTGRQLQWFIDKRKIAYKKIKFYGEKL